MMSHSTLLAAKLTINLCEQNFVHIHFLDDAGNVLACAVMTGRVGLEISADLAETSAYQIENDDSDDGIGEVAGNA